MTYGDAVPSRFGSVANGADGTFANDYALFLKVWSGEVLNAFAEVNRMMPLHMVRTIASGKQAQFPITGKATAQYHVAGTLIEGANPIPSNERVISIDNPLIADQFIANVDEAMSHFDVRAEYTRQIARALANTADKNLLKVGVLAARASANYSGGFGGSALNLTSAVLTDDGSIIFKALFDAQTLMNQKDVPEEDRFCILPPAVYEKLASSTNVHNTLWGGQGTIADGKAPRLAGFQIMWSNHLPSTVVSAVTGENNTYSGTFTDTVGLCFQREALGTVKLRDLTMESEYQMNRQGTLLIAKYLMGHGILRPECAIELTKT